MRFGEPTHKAHMRNLHCLLGFPRLALTPEHRASQSQFAPLEILLDQGHVKREFDHLLPQIGGITVHDRVRRGPFGRLNIQSTPVNENSREKANDEEVWALLG